MFFTACAGKVAASAHASEQSIAPRDFNLKGFKDVVPPELHCTYKAAALSVGFVAGVSGAQTSRTLRPFTDNSTVSPDTSCYELTLRSTLDDVHRGGDE